MKEERERKRNKRKKRKREQQTGIKVVHKNVSQGC
jgi:hypothetical protein